MRFICLLSFAAMLFGRDLKNVEFARPMGITLELDAWLPDNPAKPQPVLLLVHGGGWEAGDKRTYIRPWFETLTQAGLHWVTINYRLGPRSKHPAAVEDIETALRWLRSHAREYGIDPKRITLMGESAGAHLGALAALRGKVQVAGFVGFYGIYDVPKWVEGYGNIPQNIGGYLASHDRASLDEASPVRYLKTSSPRLLLIHGKADTGVPFAQSEDLCAAAKTKQISCEMLLIEGAPHGVENWEADSRFHGWKPVLLEWLRKAR